MQEACWKYLPTVVLLSKCVTFILQPMVKCINKPFYKSGKPVNPFLFWLKKQHEKRFKLHSHTHAHIYFKWSNDTLFLLKWRAETGNRLHDQIITSVPWFCFKKQRIVSIKPLFAWYPFLVLALFWFLAYCLQRTIVEVPTFTLCWNSIPFPLYVNREIFFSFSIRLKLVSLLFYECSFTLCRILFILVLSIQCVMK